MGGGGMTDESTNNQPERAFFLSEVTNAKILLNNKKIGKLLDLIISNKAKVAEVTYIVINRPFGYPSLMVPWSNVSSFGEKEIAIELDDVEKFACKIPEGSILLKDYILDKKILDLEDADVEIVYDIKMVLRKNKLFITDVDPSKNARFRRLGLDKFANRIHKKNDKSKEELIPWSYVQPLPPNIGSFTGDLKLKVLKEKLNDLPPVDIVEILEELDHEQRLTVINQLEAEHASDTLEEIGPNMQREIISSMKKETVADLIDRMTPGQAADVLSVLTLEDRTAIMKLMDKDNLDKIGSILEKRQDTILNLTSEKYLRAQPYETVETVQDEYPKRAKGKDEIMYIHVTDNNNRLLGIIDVKELLQADDEALLKDIMNKNVITLKKESSIGEATKMFSRYGFRSLPVVDNENNLIGVVRHRDVAKLTLHFLE
ncbi:MAG: magnesium transporter MgtE N-terminal domain-containing protein [Syntrophothermus sp.]